MVNVQDGSRYSSAVMTFSDTGDGAKRRVGGRYGLPHPAT